MKTETDPIVTKIRYRFLDSLRGLCVMGMVLYHALFDVVYLFGFDLESPFMQGVNIIRDLGAACFICMSGMTFSLGHHHLKRSVIMSAAGTVITAVTYIVMPDSFVIFGILTFMGAACMLMIPLEKLFKYVPPVVGLVCSLVLFIVFFECAYGYIGYYKFTVALFPEWLYKNYITAFFGFPFPGFASGDYFGFIPWIFMYFFGYFAQKVIAGNDRCMKLMQLRIPVLEKTGKLSLYIYIVHQPVLYFIVYGLSRLVL